MFSLNDKTITTPLDTINLITLTYYSSKSELFNIYDMQFIFDENIIPLITSILEVKPNVIHAKRYTNINSESLIIIDANDTLLPNKSRTSFQSFYHDMQVDNMQYAQSYKRDLVSSQDIIDNKLIVRTYNLDKNSIAKNSSNNSNSKSNNEYGKCILNEEEILLIVWSWEYAYFQIIINKLHPTKCQLQMNIYITEEHTIITNKIQNVNNIIMKIEKIKNMMTMMNDI